MDSTSKPLEYHPFVARVSRHTVDLWWPGTPGSGTLDGWRRENSPLGITISDLDGPSRYPHLQIRGYKSTASWTIRGDSNIGSGMLLLLREVIDASGKHGFTNHAEYRGHLTVRHFADALVLLADQVWMRYNSKAGTFRNRLHKAEVMSAVALLRAACYPLPADINPSLATFYTPFKEGRVAHVAMLPIGPFAVHREDGEGGDGPTGRQALLSINGQHCVIREAANEFEAAMIEMLSVNYGTRRDQLGNFWSLAAQYADHREEMGDLEKTYLDILRSGIFPLPWTFGIPNHEDKETGRED